MATVAQYLVGVLTSLNRTTDDVFAVDRYVPEVGEWASLGKMEFIAAAQAKDHPLPVTNWYRFRSNKGGDEDMWLLYNGQSHRVVDPGAVYPFTADHLDGTTPFPS